MYNEKETPESATLIIRYSNAANKFVVIANTLISRQIDV